MGPLRNDRDRSLNRGRSGHKVRSSIISGLPSNASELTKTMIQDGAKRALKKQVINKVMGDSKKDAESRERKKSRKTPRDSEGLPTPRDPAQTKTKTKSVQKSQVTQQEGGDRTPLKKYDESSMMESKAEDEGQSSFGKSTRYKNRSRSRTPKYRI